MPARLVIIDDQKMVREYMGWVCTSEADCEVVGEAGLGSEVDALIQQTRPEILLLDIMLPDETGFAVAARAYAAQPGLRVILMSGHCDEVTIRQIELARVHGFIDKNFSQASEIKEAVRTVLAGKRFFSRSYQIALQNQKSNPLSFDKLFTDREQQVVGFITCALTDQEIAQRLQLKPNTVETHRRNIMGKLGVHSTPQLIKYAIDHGFIHFLAKVHDASQKAGAVAAFICLPVLADFATVFSDSLPAMV